MPAKGRRENKADHAVKEVTVTFSKNFKHLRE